MKKINLNSSSDEYLFNLLGVENFRKDSSSRLRHYFNFIRENESKLDGNIWEFGVFKGASLIATALLLKEIGSNKKVYGMDSFSGFPSYDEMDSLEQFSLKCPLVFSEDFCKKANQSHEIVEYNSKIQAQANNISTSGTFNDTSLEFVNKKIEDFGLDNIILIEGPFEKTIPSIEDSSAEKIFAANIDCDLYLGYKIALQFCWKSLIHKGFIHLDEYYSLKFPGAKIATEEFCSLQNIRPTKLESRVGEFERWAIIKSD
jgi:hypothetical protein